MTQKWATSRIGPHEFKTMSLLSTNGTIEWILFMFVHFDSIFVNKLNEVDNKRILRYVLNKKDMFIITKLPFYFRNNWLIKGNKHIYKH